MRTVTLSGWGQPHDALLSVAPDAVAVDYAHAANIDEVFRMLAPYADSERVIGWSLGGQLAVRAIVAGIFKPKQLVLIAAPYRFVGEGGMAPDEYEKFERNYSANPSRTLDKAWELVHYNDTRSGYIREHMQQFDKQSVLARNWLRWLRLLAGFKADELSFGMIPNALIVHGTEDVVVDVKQSELWKAYIPNPRRVLWQGCGHAPHFHDAEKLRALIEEHAHV